MQAALVSRKRDSRKHLHARVYAVADSSAGRVVLRLIRTNFLVVNIFRSNSRAEQIPHGRLSEVEEELAVSLWPKEAFDFICGESLGESILQLAPDLVALFADAGAKGGHNMRRVATKALGHHADGIRCDPAADASPSTVGDSGDVILWVVKKQRQAIGRVDAEHGLG